ncbi:MAG: AAA family ATPase [Gemmatimonadales bacterium]|nr:AAA family ATPase [Gemmatimonadales bacterium]
MSDSVEWVGEADTSDAESVTELTAVDPSFLLAVGRGGQEVVEHASGVFRLRVSDHTVFALAFTTGLRDGRHSRRFVALAGQPRETLAGIYRDICAAGAKRRMTIWGAAGVPRRLRVQEVPEEDVLLAPELKSDLLAWLDRFWTLRDLAAAHHLPARRGLLLVGLPGTGKTTLLRHLLTRYQHADVHVFIPTSPASAGREPAFETMISIAQGAGRDVIVILEDIDRLAESGAITAAGLLNHLDGLLTIDVPALWIATSNDPTTLDRSLLERPGRFDRTVVLSLPEEAQRAAMLRKYSRLTLDETLLVRAIALSEGLTGAHLREACTSATLRALDLGSQYGCVLLTELERVRRERDQAREMHRLLQQQQRAGFASQP